MKKSDSKLFCHLFLELTTSLRHINQFGDLSKKFATMIMESTRLLLEKITVIDTKNFTEQDYYQIADLYIETLSEVIAETCQSFAQDSSSACYRIHEVKLEKLKKYFAGILVSGFKHEITMELFYNLFLMSFFPAFENSCKHKQKVQKENQKVKQKISNS